MHLRPKVMLSHQIHQVQFLWVYACNEQPALKYQFHHSLCFYRHLSWPHLRYFLSHDALKNYRDRQGWSLFIKYSRFDWEKTPVPRFTDQVVIAVGSANEDTSKRWYNLLAPLCQSVVISLSRGECFDHFNFCLILKLKFSEFDTPIALEVIKSISGCHMRQVVPELLFQKQYSQCCRFSGPLFTFKNDEWFRFATRIFKRTTAWFKAGYLRAFFMKTARFSDAKIIDT